MFMTGFVVEKKREKKGGWIFRVQLEARRLIKTQHDSIVLMVVRMNSKEVVVVVVVVEEEEVVEVVVVLLSYSTFD